MKKIFLSSIIVILCILFAFGGVVISDLFFVPKKTFISSMMIAAMSRNELIYKSDLIIRGKVMNVISSEWSNPNKILGNDKINEIKTYVSVDILNIYKGTPYVTGNVIVEIEGGQIGSTIYKDTSAPGLKKDEMVILFLDDKNKYPHLETYPVKNSYSILGYSQGKYLYKDDNTYVAKISSEDRTINLSTFSEEIAYGLNEYPKTRKPDLTLDEIHAINRQSMGE